MDIINSRFADISGDIYLRQSCMKVLEIHFSMSMIIGGCQEPVIKTIGPGFIKQLCGIFSPRRCSQRNMSSWCTSLTNEKNIYIYIHTVHLAISPNLTKKVILLMKKSCTTWDVQNPVNNVINYLSTGAGFLPSTVHQLFYF